jgi:DNA-binding NtrC family response regulator
VGADRPVKVDVRVVAATHRDLADDMESGRFREDFYFRIAAYEIVLPPLRDRPSDIPQLVEFFRHRVEAEFGLATATPASDEVLEALATFPWPGNVRQLEHFVRRALVDHSGLASPSVLAALPRLETTTEPGTEPRIGGDLTLEELERRHIEAVLARCSGNRTHAAKILGIERKSLYRKARRLGIELDGELEDG